MKYVVDSNCLRDDLLHSHLRRSSNHIAVITDYAAMEALKGDPLVGMYESMKILAQFPKQVQILKTTGVICGLSGDGKGLQRRFVDVPQSNQFELFCRNLVIAKSGSTSLKSQLLSLGAEAREHLTRMQEDAVEFAEASVEVARQFSPDERRSIVLGHGYNEAVLKKILAQVMYLSKTLFGKHPAVSRLPSSDEIINTYIFRFALCSLLLGFEYESKGGVSGKAPEKIRNDKVDSHFATYATFFNGLLSKDKRTTESPRVLRRLHHLREWSHEEIYEVFARAA